MTSGKTIALTRWTFVGTVMSLLLNMLSRLVKTFLPRRKRLLNSWLQSPSAVILEPPNIKSVTISPSICYEVMVSDATQESDCSSRIVWLLFLNLGGLKFSKCLVNDFCFSFKLLHIFSFFFTINSFILFLRSCTHLSILLLLLSRYSRIRLCDPIDGSPPGFLSLGFAQLKILKCLIKHAFIYHC